MPGDDLIIVGAHSCDEEHPNYGYFEGGDPHLFIPDPDDSTLKEHEHHRAECERFKQQESQGVSSALVAQTCKDERTFGMGINWCCKKHMEVDAKR